MMAETVTLFGPKTEAKAALNRQQIVDTLHELLAGHSDLRAFPGNFKIALRDKVWTHKRQLAGGSFVEPMSFHDFVHLRYPTGLGADYATIERLISHDAEALVMWRQLVVAAPGKPNEELQTPYSIRNLQPHGVPPSEDVLPLFVPPLHGTAKSYTLARLSRDFPPLYDAVKRGELSANAAAIEAGFRKKFTKFEQIVRWLPSLTPDERERLRAML